MLAGYHVFSRFSCLGLTQIIYFELYPHLGEKKTKLNLTIISDIYIWQLHLTFITDIYIWQLHLAFISDIYLWRLYLTFLFDIYIWHFYLTFISDIYLWRLHLTFLFDIYVWHVVPCIFHDCFQNSREKCIEYIFQYCFQKSSEKCIGSPNPLFYRCKFFSLRKTIHFFKKLERNSPHLINTGGSWLRQ